MKIPKAGSPLRKRTAPVGSVTLTATLDNCDCAIAETDATLMPRILALG